MSASQPLVFLCGYYIMNMIFLYIILYGMSRYCDIIIIKIRVKNGTRQGG